jgi:hypothetical protein
VGLTSLVDKTIQLAYAKGRSRGPVIAQLKTARANVETANPDVQVGAIEDAHSVKVDDENTALRRLASWIVAEHGPGGTLGDVLQINGLGDAPESVASSAQALLTTKAVSLAGRWASRYDVAATVIDLIAKLDDRRQLVLRRRWFERSTLEDIAGALRVTRERVRQVETQAIETIESHLQRPDFECVRHAVDRLRRRLGILSPSVAARDWGPTLDRRIPRWSIRVGEFVLRLIGPFQERHGWIAWPSLDHAEAAARVAVRSVLSQKIGELSAVRGALEAIGFAPAAQIKWLTERSPFVIEREDVLDLGGLLADATETVLRHTGSPLEREEISKRIAKAHSKRTLSNYLLTDKRFRRVGPARFGLAEWGGEEYTSVSDEMAEEIERRGGEADIEYLVKTLCKRFGVAASSVRGYAASHRFVNVGRGRIRLATGNVRKLSGDDLSGVRRCYRRGAGWALRVPVNPDMLRGSGRIIPSRLASFERVLPGKKASMTFDEVRVNLSWVGPQPTIGSVKAIAERLSCQEGDWLFLCFLPGRLGSAHRLAKTELTKGAALARLVLLVGGEAALDQSVRERLDVVAQAISLPTGSPVEAVRARLVARGEDDLAGLLEEDSTKTQDQDVEDLLGFLGFD